MARAARSLRPRARLCGAAAPAGADGALLDARETLQHPWIVGAGEAAGAEEEEGPPPVESLDTVHEMMRRFNAERRLRRAFWVVVACGRFQRALTWAQQPPGES